MEHRFNSKTPKAELIEMLKDDEAVIEELTAEVEQLRQELAESNDTIYNLRLYLCYAKKNAKDLWKAMMQQFPHLPGFAYVRVKKGAKK